MRVPLRALLVIAFLAGSAHAQSLEVPSTQGRQPADAVIDQPGGAPSTDRSRDGGAAGSAGSASGQASSLPLDAGRHIVWVEILDRSLATGQRELTEVWGFLLERNWVPPLLTLFNGLVAVFAYWLWKSTSSLIGLAREQSRDLKEMIVVAREAADAAKRSAEAASLQARAMVGAELPRLELGSVNLANSDQSVRQALRAPSVDIQFTNYGRTTALVIEKCVEVRLGHALPSEPTYDFVEVLPVVEAVESGKSVGAAAHRRLGDLSDTQVQGLLGGLNNIWVYGFVRFRDFLGMQHKMGFCLRWTPPHRDASTGGSFVPEDPGAYIYQTDDWSLAQVENERSPSAKPYLGPHLAAAAE
ncbi:MAG: hypothetical protein ACLQJR_25585 [Stellaceae bacterium]